MSGGDYVVIDKLSSTNYSTWRDDVKVLLMEKGLWEYVTVKAVTPTDTSKESKGVDDPVLPKRVRAYSIIYLNVSKEFRPLLSGFEDPYLAWESLEKHFRPISTASSFTLITIACVH